MTQHSTGDTGTPKDLAKYRIELAKEALQSAERNLSIDDYRTANNRAYYAIFYAVSACLALESKAFKSHAQTLGSFNKDFIHTGIFPKELSRMISSAELIRQRSDYDDFYVLSKDSTITQVENARNALAIIAPYITKAVSSGID